jgi:uncharacterized membrane protein
MWTFFKLLAVVVPVVILLDYVWIGRVMYGFYDAEFGPIARRNAAGGIAPRWPAVLMVYLVIPAAIILFVRPHLGPDSSLPTAFAWGAAFGLALYGVYDLTNYSLLDRWSLRLTLIDMAWGAVLCGTSAAAMHLAEGWISR